MPKRRPDDSLPPVQFSEVTGLDDVMQSRQPGRSRAVVAGLVALVLVVIAVGLIQRRLPFLNYTAVTVTTSSINSTSQPLNRPIQLQTNIFYSLMLNGKPLTLPTLTTFQLSQATNDLSFNAPPFLPLSCTITWPPAQGGDNCQSNSTTTDEHSVSTVYIVDFQVGIDDLPSDQRTQASSVLLTTAQKAAAQMQLPVPIGDYYPYAYDSNGLPLSRRATTPLTATLGIDDLAQSYCNEPICPGQLSPGTRFQKAAIDFAFNANFSWHFTTNAATPVGTFALTQPGKYNQNVPSSLDLGLTYDAAQGWQAVTVTGVDSVTYLTEENNGNLCSLAAGAITQALQKAGTATSGYGFPHGSAEGCQIDIYSNNSNHPDGSFIERFGALLAADAGGHKLLPGLPMAPRDEIRIVESGG